MCWGIDCSDGWYDLIDKLCSHLQFNTDNNSDPQVVASQVKEKFGGLRFYVNGASSEQHAVISFVEGLSYHICEECGSNKEVTQTTGWIKTLCSDCLAKEEVRREIRATYIERDNETEKSL